MTECCLIKKVATVKVYENKNEVTTYGFMAGDKNTPTMEVEFNHLWGEESLSECKLRWIIVDDVGSLLLGEVPIKEDNTATIKLPNELFDGERRMKVQLTVASCDGDRILNLQQFTDLKVINNLATNEVVEPVYKILINGLYEDVAKYLDMLENSYTQKYGSLETLFVSAKSSLEEYLITAENGGNAEFLQGYTPAMFQKTCDSIADLKASFKYKVGDVVQVLGYYEKGDGAHHHRKITNNPSKPYLTLSNGLKAELLDKVVRPEWIGTKNIHDVIETHIKPLADNSGYTILLHKGEYTCIGWGFDGARRMNTLKDLSIIGSGKPEISLPNKEKLLGGTIIHGSIANSADGFKIKDFGVDLGAEWVDANNFIGWFGQKGNEGIILNEALDIDNHPKLITGCMAENIIVNMYNNSNPYHAFLNEASTGNYCNNIETHGGLHGFVVKCSDITCNNIKTHGGSANSVIVKTDVRAIRGVRFNNLQVYPYKTKGDSNGINIQPNGIWNMLDVSFNNVFVNECAVGFIGNAHTGVVANLEMNNVVVSDCVHPTDLTVVSAGLTWSINDLRVVNSGSFFLPISGQKIIRNLIFEQYLVSPTLQGNELFRIYENTYLNGFRVSGMEGYRCGGAIVDEAVNFTISSCQANASIDVNNNPFFVNDGSIGIVLNELQCFLVTNDYTTKNGNTYLYQKYNGSKIEISFCLLRDGVAGGNVILYRNPKSKFGLVRDQRFACGRSSNLESIPLVSDMAGNISTERTTIADMDYVYGTLSINANLQPVLP